MILLLDRQNHEANTRAVGLAMRTWRAGAVAVAAAGSLQARVGRTFRRVALAWKREALAQSVRMWKLGLVYVH